MNNMMVHHSSLSLSKTDINTLMSQTNKVKRILVQRLILSKT
jgi:hypothetical protein